MSDTVVAKLNKSEDGQQSAERRSRILPKGRMLAAVIGGGIVLLSAVALGIALGYPKIYGSVYFGDIPLGGQTVEQAREIVVRTSREVLEGKAITLTIDGVSEDFSSDLIHLPADEIARKAYDLGHTGGIFPRIGFVISSLFSRKNVELSSNYIDLQALETQISLLAQKLDKPALEYAVEVESDHIVVTNARTGCELPQEPLKQLLTKKLADEDFSPITYATQPLPPRQLDLRKLHDEVAVEPKDAYLDITDKHDVKIMPHVMGISFDIGQAEALQAAGGDSFIIPLIRTAPELTQEMLKDGLFRDELSSFSTGLSGSSASRINNITIAAGYINGTILLPGDTFSYNDVVGERTKARGFQTAGAYQNGRVVDEVGGGICQMSSTLYNSALFADLEIVERQNHSMLVSYVHPGMDATVNWGTIDFKFSNNTGYPLRVRAWVEGKTLHTKLEGTKTNDYTVTMERDTLSTNNYTTIRQVNGALPAGTEKVITPGHTGTVVQTYRVVKDSQGNEISRSSEARSSYKRVDKIIEVSEDKATETPEGEPPAAENNADSTPPATDTPLENTPPNTPGEQNPSPEPDGQGVPPDEPGEPAAPQMPGEQNPPEIPAGSDEEIPFFV